MNCSKCGEALRLHERVKCDDCKEEEAKIDARAENLVAEKKLATMRRL